MGIYNFIQKHTKQSHRHTLCTEKTPSIKVSYTFPCLAWRSLLVLRRKRHSDNRVGCSDAVNLIFTVCLHACVWLSSGGGDRRNKGSLWDPGACYPDVSRLLIQHNIWFKGIVGPQNISHSVIIYSSSCQFCEIEYPKVLFNIINKNKWQKTHHKSELSAILNLYANNRLKFDISQKYRSSDVQIMNESFPWVRYRWSKSQN